MHRSDIQRDLLLQAHTILGYSFQLSDSHGIFLQLTSEEPLVKGSSKKLDRSHLKNKFNIVSDKVKNFFHVLKAKCHMNLSESWATSQHFCFFFLNLPTAQRWWLSNTCMILQRKSGPSLNLPNCKNLIQKAKFNSLNIY